jgi:hypothetical protein
MLSSLLPGLREIRAPLAAGYVWLVVAWLLLHDRIDQGSSATGAVSALTEFRDAIGLGGVAAATTFVAYLLGALWEPISTRAAEVLWFKLAVLHWRVDPDAYEYDPSEGFAHTRHPSEDSPVEAADNPIPFVAPLGRFRITDSGWSRLWLIGQRLVTEVDETLAVRLGSSFDPHATTKLLHMLDSETEAYFPVSDKRTSMDSEGTATEAQERRFSQESDGAKAALSELELTSPRDSWWIRETADFAGKAESPSLYRVVLHPWYTVLALEKKPDKALHFLTELAVTYQLLDELPRVARRLVGEQQELFLEGSRMKGEVEFRHALAIPIPIAVTVVAFGLGLPWWVWLLATVAGLVAGWALLADGWRRDLTRNLYIVDLLAIDKAKSPTFERLRERADRLGSSTSPGRRRAS